MFLNSTNIMYDFLQEVEKSVLNESHGVLLNYSDYVYELYNELINIKPELIDVGIYKYSLIDYHLNVENSFIDTININLFVYTDKQINNDGEYIMNNDSYSDLTKNLKLKNATFIIKASSKEKMISRDVFRNIFVHELHHAYRYWSLLVKNNNSIPDGEKYRSERYENIFNRQKVLTNKTNAEQILY